MLGFSISISVDVEGISTMTTQRERESVKDFGSFVKQKKKFYHIFKIYYQFDVITS